MTVSQANHIIGPATVTGTITISVPQEDLPASYDTGLVLGALADGFDVVVTDVVALLADVGASASVSRSYAVGADTSNTASHDA